MPYDPKKNRIFFICLAVAFGGLLFGFDTAVISGTIEPVKHQFNMNAAAEGWFVSSGLVGCIAGVIIAGLLSDLFGRRPALRLAAIAFLLSGIGCGLSESPGMLVSFRIIGGIGVGIASVTAPIYITEFSPASIRGKMVAFYQLAITIGILLAYFSNAMVASWTPGITGTASFMSWLFTNENWRGMFMMMSIPSIVFLILLLLIPESPRWLIQKRKNNKALAILTKILPEQKAKEELTAVTNAKTAKQGISSSVFAKQYRIPLLIGIMLAVFQQFSGINAIIYYGPEIFKKAGLAGDDALQVQVIIGLVNVLFTFIAIVKSDKIGRKPLLLAGLTGMIVSLIITGFCFYLGYTSGVLLLAMILLFIACFALSAGPLTWILINEIFPNEIRLKAVSICTLALWMAVWVVGQFFPWLLQQIGPAGVFWIFAACSLINLIFCLNVLIETKGKTLEQIEEIYLPVH